MAEGAVKTPELSVVIPNYNHAKYLPRCLESVLAQSVQPKEIIVLDDCSTDNSIEVVEGFARKYPHVRLHRNERNLGVVGNMNRGIEVAAGEYVFSSSADDAVVPGFFEKSLRLLVQHPRAALSCTVSTWHAVDTGLTWHMGAGLSQTPCYFSPRDLIRLGKKPKFIICSSSAIFKRSTLNEIGRYLPELRWHCDWYVTFVLAFRYGMCYIPEPLSNFYLHSTSYYHKGRKHDEHRQVLARLLDRLNSPECGDVAPGIRESAVLGLFGTPILKLMLGNRSYQQFLTARLLMRIAYRNAELIGKKILPKPVARLALRLLYRADKG